MLQKIGHDLLNLCAICGAQNADNARTLRIWFDVKRSWCIKQLDNCQEVTVV